MLVDLEIVRTHLPDGRPILVERRPGFAWDVRFESEPGRPETGSPLLVVLAHLLGHELVPESWPWWLFALAEDVQAAFDGRAPP